MAHIAVILSGCGYLDGSAIQEAVATFLALDRAGATCECFAPDVDQADVVDHRSGEATGETRNVLAEASRIARGEIAPLADFEPDRFDGLAMPGGFGVAKNLTSFAADGPECTVHPEFERAVRAIRAAGKPIAALCIAPAAVARILAADAVTVTIGDQEPVAEAIEKMGAKHQNCKVTDVVVDEDHKLVTTPCYMYDDARISEIAEGADKAVKQLLAWC